ncbi:MAG: hypothetical protein WC454_05995 [Phycisphaerae bacterium]|jgi:hypothetical protein
MVGEAFFLTPKISVNIWYHCFALCLEAILPRIEMGWAGKSEASLAAGTEVGGYYFAMGIFYFDMAQATSSTSN